MTKTMWIVAAIVVGVLALLVGTLWYFAKWPFSGKGKENAKGTATVVVKQNGGGKALPKGLKPDAKLREFAIQYAKRTGKTVDFGLGENLGKLFVDGKEIEIGAAVEKAEAEEKAAPAEPEVAAAVTE